MNKRQHIALKETTMKIINRSVRLYPDYGTSPSTGAKSVTAVLRAEKLDAVLKSVKTLSASSGVTVSEVRAHHSSGAWTERRAEVDFDISAVSWVRIKLFVHKSSVDEIVELLHRIGQVSPDRLWISATGTPLEIIQDESGLFHVQN
jgi:nitrogen regulatory protein PII